MRPVMNGDFPETCGTCGETRRYEGPRRKQRIVCGCTLPEKPKPRLNTARKGRRVELKMRKTLEQLGVTKLRAQPGSGAFGTRNADNALTGDNAFTIAGRAYRQEVKARASDSGFRVVKNWMRDCDFLTIVQDREKPLHVLSDETFRHLVASANGGGG